MTEPSFLRDTRAAYDAVAADYAERFLTELDGKPLGRAMLAAFAELVRAAGAGPVAEVGCGPGHVTAHLDALGISAFGIDLSPAMVALARSAHPGLRFEEGSMTALDLPDGGLGGVVAWYSIIHIPADHLPAVLAEVHRVLAPGGLLLLAFQVREEVMHLAEGLGQAMSLDFHPWQPDTVAELLARAGFVVEARLLREPDETETVPQAHLLARRRRTAGGPEG
jgi:SAM-dependent methyltransferase